MMNTTNLKERATLDQAGCWIDGHWGQYGASRLIEIAQDWGFSLDEDDKAAVQAFNVGSETFLDADEMGTHYTFEWVAGQGGLADKAEEWMNENVAPEGYAFGWNDGEFFLWSEEYWGLD